MTTTLDSLLAACEQDYTNPDLYLITADYLEEQDQNALAQAFRWCGTNAKYPRRSSSYDKHGRWFWICWESHQNPPSSFRQGNTYCTLPPEFREKVEGGTLKVSRSWLAAMHNLARVFT